MNKTHFVLGGDLKKSLTEGYRLDFKTLFKDAFAITRSNFLPLIIACLITTSIVVSLFLFTAESLLEMSEVKQLIINFLFSSFIVAPLVTGLQMMGIHHAIGLKSRATDLFNFFNIVLKLALASIIINLIIYLTTTALSKLLGDYGFIISILAVLYLNIAVSMVYPLIAEKKVSPQLAIRLSFRLVNKNLFQFTILFGLLTLLAFIALIPSGIGMFFFIPFYFNLMGIIYRQVCGVGVVATDVSDDDPSDKGSPESKNSSEFEA